MSKRYFWWNFKRFSDSMSYYLFKPNTPTRQRPRPLIVWLHGSGEVAAGKREFLSAGLPNVLLNWSLKPFNAYILCPQLTIEDDIWDRDENVEELMKIIEKVCSEVPINRRKIILAGHSLGAMGAMYIAERIHDFFSCMCVLSGYEIGVDLTKIKTPVLGIVGTEEAEEDPESVEFMTGHFDSNFGSHTVWELDASHEDIPARAFLDDADLDGSSDLIKWMFSYHL